MYLETALDSWPNSSLASWEIWRSRYLGNRYWRTQLSHAPCDIWTSLSLYWHWGLDALWASLVFSDTKESACNAGDLGSVSGLGRSPGGGNGNPLQYSCLKSHMDRRAWWAWQHTYTSHSYSLRSSVIGKPVVQPSLSFVHEHFSL